MALIIVCSTAVMMRLFVRPANRGMGAARVLVNAAMRFARRCRYGRVVLDMKPTGDEPHRRFRRDTRLLCA